MVTVLNVSGEYLHKRLYEVGDSSKADWWDCHMLILLVEVVYWVYGPWGGHRRVECMRNASAKSWSTRGASHQPAFMSSCLTISHTCLPCLPSGRTLLFLSDLFVVGRVVSWERWESSGPRGWIRGRVVSWEGGKGV